MRPPAKSGFCQAAGAPRAPSRSERVGAALRSLRRRKKWLSSGSGGDRLNLAACRLPTSEHRAPQPSRSAVSQSVGKLVVSWPVPPLSVFSYIRCASQKVYTRWIKGIGVRPQSAMCPDRSWRVRTERPDTCPPPTSSRQPVTVSIMSELLCLSPRLLMENELLFSVPASINEANGTPVPHYAGENREPRIG